MAEIKKLRERCDYLVVYVHWGIEQDGRPPGLPARAGAAVHRRGGGPGDRKPSHVLQGLGTTREADCLQSGQFRVRQQYPQDRRPSGGLGRGTTSLRLVPATSAAGYTRMVTDEAKQQEFYSYMTGISYGVSVTGRASCSNPRKQKSVSAGCKHRRPVSACAWKRIHGKSGFIS